MISWICVKLFNQIPYNCYHITGYSSYFLLDQFQITFYPMCFSVILKYHGHFSGKSLRLYFNLTTPTDWLTIDIWKEEKKKRVEMLHWISLFVTVSVAIATSNSRLCCKVQNSAWWIRTNSPRFIMLAVLDLFTDGPEMKLTLNARSCYVGVGFLTR